jgi:hypothetical protein
MVNPWLRLSDDFIVFLLGSFAEEIVNCRRKLTITKPKQPSASKRPSKRTSPAELARQWCSLAEQAERQGARSGESVERKLD